MIWIRCDERMPEDMQIVLMVRQRGKKPEVDSACYHADIGFFEPISGYHWLESVTHWQSLPEPPND